MVVANTGQQLNGRIQRENILGNTINYAERGKTYHSSAMARTSRVGYSYAAGQPKGIILEGTRIIGTIELANGMQVDGEVQGKLFSEGEVFFGAAANIEGNVVARKITVSGKIVGDLLAEERIELCAPAVVNGSIAAPKIVIHDGVVFSGACEMQNPEANVRVNGNL